MTETTSDVLLEIGCEELPASFVDAAVRALPDLAKKRLSDLRLAFESATAMGTPRRLALLVCGVALRQPDLEEELTGPPVKAAFKDGAPTKAAEAFAQKLGCPVAELRRVETPKGEYLAGTRREPGRPAEALLPDALAAIVTSIPFRKSMRWGSGDFAFGRPVHWIVALLGERVIDLSIAGVRSGRETRGHRFLGPPGPIAVASPAAYVATLREAHVLVDPAERERVMMDRLAVAAREAGGTLIEDEFLVRENVTMIEEPHVIAGGFAEEFLELPERVILEVAKGHQRYFGVRGPKGLLPRYLAVVNTAVNPENVRRGNDRVMRARLADARFFYGEDLRVPLVERRAKLGGIVFQKRLGTVLAKAERIERLARELGLLLMLPEATLVAAAAGAHLAKCDLVTLMVGEFPELEGEMGRAYALAQGVSPEVADVIRDHYAPKGAAEPTAPTDAAALVAIADRLDTLVGCFAIGLAPTGTTDPFGLRRACIGVLRTMLDRGLDLRLDDALRAAYDGYEGVKLDLDRDALVANLGDFFAERLKGLLGDKYPADVVAACLAVAGNRPLDVRARAAAIAELDPATRASVGEVFKRATNIAESAPPGEPAPPASSAQASEIALYEGYLTLRERLASHARAADYAAALREMAGFAPLLARFFADVYVMTDDIPARENRLRLMRAISESCGALAKLELLGAG